MGLIKGILGYELGILFKCILLGTDLLLALFGVYRINFPGIVGPQTITDISVAKSKVYMLFDKVLVYFAVLNSFCLMINMNLLMRDECLCG